MSKAADRSSKISTEDLKSSLDSLRASTTESKTVLVARQTSASESEEKDVNECMFVGKMCLTNNITIIINLSI